MRTEYYPKRKLIFILLLFISPFSHSKTFKQRLYEDLKKKSCSDATTEEFGAMNRLNCLNSAGLSKNLKDLNDINENIFFKYLASQMSELLDCRKIKLEGLIKNKAALASSKANSCSNLEQLVPLMKLKNKLAEEIQRNISLMQNASTPFNRLKGLDEKGKHLKEWYYKVNDQFSVLLSFDPIISNSNILSKVEKQISKVSADALEGDSKGVIRSICEDIIGPAEIDLNKALAEITKSKEYCDKAARGHSDWSGDEVYKKNLWRAGIGSGIVFDLLNKDRDEKGVRQKDRDILVGGLFCRLDANYGEGADIWEGLMDILGFVSVPALEGVTILSFARKARAARRMRLSQE